MSRLLVLLNRLKVEARRDWLTDSQLIALAEIERAWRFPERVNLHGPSGTGKTFLAWSLARSSSAAYYPSPRTYYASAAQEQTRVVIDNAPDDARAMRHLLGELQIHNARTALIITALPNRLGLPAVALSRPNSQDVDVVYRNLSLLDYYSLRPLYSENLWAVVEQVL